MRRLVEIVHELHFRLRSLFGRSRMARELDEEMSLHREMLANDLECSGTPAADAHVLAGKRLGNAASIRERSRDCWGFPRMDALWNDVTFGWRLLRRSPLFAIVAITALAVSIGINAGFYTLIDALMWQPTPVRDPARLVRLFNVNAQGRTGIMFSYPDVLALRARSTTPQDIVGYDAEPVALRGPLEERAIAASAGLVTGNYFLALGGPAARGRMLLPSDDETGATPVAVISNHYWARLGNRTDVVGRHVAVNGTDVEIVGVAPMDFIGLNPLVPDLWLPFHVGARAHAAPGDLLDRPNRYIVVHARLAPDAGAALAEAEASSIIAEPPAPPGSAAALARIVAVGTTPSASLIPFTAETIQIAIPAMLIVGLVLVIACANLANLLLGRAIARQREIAVRLAIGASRLRLIRQLLVECFMIAALGALLGLWLANRTVAGIEHSMFAHLPSSSGVLHLPLQASWRVFAYTGLLACVSVFLFGVAPALQATTPDLTSALKGEDRVLGTRLRRSRFRDTLIAGQVAACVTLLAAAATLVQGLRSATPRDLGVATDKLMAVSLGLNGEGNTAGALVRSRATLAARVARLHGVRATARVLAAPFTGIPMTRVKTSTGQSYLAILYDVVTPSYFAMMKQPLVAGRAFDVTDSLDASQSVIVTAAAARALWPSTQAVGQSLRVAGHGGSRDEIRRVVGVVADARIASVWTDDSRGYVFLPAGARDFAAHEMPLLVERTTGALDASAAIASIAELVDRDAPLRVEPVNAELDVQIMPFRYSAGIAAAVGLVGLALAVMGLYGVVSFAVTQRRRDLAVHLAMGATSRDVLRLVVMREMRIVVVGLGVGLIGAAAIARTVSALAIPLAPLGASGLLAVAVILALAALAAMIVPSIGAMRISPMRVLRQE